MIRLACNIPRNIIVACSGGPDSMALLDFCYKGRKEISVIYVNHRTPHGQEAQEVVREYCFNNHIELFIHYIPSGIEHSENEWRNARLAIYKQYTQTGHYIATAHHLDDMIEWYLMSSIHGNPKYMNPVDEEFKLIKPFLLAEKQQLIGWCIKNNVKYIVDPTNIGNDNARAILRANVIPSLLKIHPGMKTSIKNKFIDEMNLLKDFK